MPPRPKIPLDQDQLFTQFANDTALRRCVGVTTRESSFPPAYWTSTVVFRTAASLNDTSQLQGLKPQSKIKYYYNYKIK